MKKQSTFSLKDHLFNRKTISKLAGWFSNNDESFDTNQFIVDCVDEFSHLELKQRITHITQVLSSYLPHDYAKALQVIHSALPSELDPTKTDDDFGEFIIAPLSEYVSTYGCSEQYYEASRHTLIEITKRFSVEFAVRKFINRFPEKTYQKFQELAYSDNYHQRRLVSEGSRISLPRAEKITPWSPDQIIKLLDRLYDDPTRYVTRSVANNLNGLSKDNPKLVLETLQRRKNEGKQDTKEFQWMTTHSLRTLLKQGHPQAYEMLGYHKPSSLKAMNISYSKIVTIGESFEITFDLSTSDDSLGKCSVRYTIGYLKKNGTYSQTVYKVAEIDTQESSMHFTKRQPMRLMTTRALYPGTHTWSIMVNGRVVEQGEFELVE